MVVRMEGAVRTLVVVTSENSGGGWNGVVVKMQDLIVAGREEVERHRKEKNKVESPNYPSNLHRNYYFTHGVVFVSIIMCPLIISHKEYTGIWFVLQI